MTRTRPSARPRSEKSTRRHELRQTANQEEVNAASPGRDHPKQSRDGGGIVPGGGILEMHPRGYGFLRDSTLDYARQPTDPYVPVELIADLDLREGVELHGLVRPRQGRKGPRLVEVSSICGCLPDEYHDVRRFESQTAVSPHRQLRLETGAVPLTTRVMDLLTPVGLGQRGLIVAPPRTGKTTLLEHISHGVAQNHPAVRQVVLLIDERPEEVTDFRCNIDGEVVASSLDEDVENHVRLTQLVVKRCQRLAEAGQDVFLLIDSPTRIARAFNKCARPGQPLTSGGIGIRALDVPKKLFAAARQLAEGGALTIVATALIDTGSQGDEVIFQEFKGTGNMELVLDRRLADQRVWPAIDICQSGTRREERLLSAETLQCVTTLRRAISPMHPVTAMAQLTEKLGKFRSNEEFIEAINRARLAD